MNKSHSKTLQIGALVNQRYRLESLLGEGGMGMVFLARDEHRNGAPVALKTLRIEMWNEHVLQMFKEEFGLLARLDYPGIARVFDFESDPQSQTVFFTSELIEGRELLAASENLNLQGRIDLCVQLCKAVDYLGARGIVHRDLKPSNILVTAEGRVKIVDFGIAAELVRRKSEKPVGTLNYMAPELLRGEAFDTRADLYSLGVVFYALFTRQLPYKAENTRELLDLFRTTQPTPPRDLCPELPGEFNDVILRMLDKDPEARFFRAAQIIEEINRFAGTPYEITREQTEFIAPMQGTFEGRAAEVEHLKKFVRDRKSAAPQSPLLCIIQGEMGMGKTRLLHEIKHWLQVQHLDVYEARHFSGMSDAYAPLRVFLQAVTQKAPAPSIANYGFYLQQILGEVEGAVFKPDFKTLQPDLEPLRLAEKVSEFLLQEARRVGGYALLIDDLDRFPPESADLLQAIFQALLLSKAPVPLILIATVDPYETSNTCEQLLEHERVQTITLSPLDHDAVSAWIKSVAGAPQQSFPWIAQLEKRAGGNPLFIAEILKTLQQGSSPLLYMRPAAQLSEDIASAGLPESMQEALSKRYLSLPAAEKEVLEIFAVFNAAVSLERIAGVMGAFDRVIPVAQDLRRRGFLNSFLLHDEVLYQFVQSYLQRLIYEGISTERRKHLHVMAAQDLEKRGGLHLEALEALAHHYLSAGEVQKGFDYAMKAAAKSAQIYAYDTAADYYEKALALLPQYPGNREALGAFLDEELARLNRYLGRFERCVLHLQQLQGHLVKQNAGLLKQTVVARQLGEVFQLQGNPHRAMEALETAQALLKKSPDLGEELRLVALRGKVLYRLGRLDQSLEESRRGLALTSEEHREERAELFYNEGIALTYRGEFDAAEEVLQKSAKLFAQLELPLRGVYPINALGIVRHQQGKAGEAVEFYVQAYETARQFGDARLAVNFAMNIGTVYQQRNDFRSAQDYYERALSAAERIHHDTERVKILVNLATLYLRYFHFEKAGDLLTSALEAAERLNLLEELSSIYFLRGQILLQRRRSAEAIDAFHKSLLLARKLGYRRVEIEALHGLVTASNEARAFGDALALLEKAGKLCDRFGSKEALLLHAASRAEYTLARFISENRGKDDVQVDEVRTTIKVAQALAQESKSAMLLWTLFDFEGQLEKHLGDDLKSDSCFMRAKKIAQEITQWIPEEYRHHFYSFHQRRWTAAMAGIYSVPAPAVDQATLSDAMASPEPATPKPSPDILPFMASLNTLKPEGAGTWFHDLFAALGQITGCNQIELRIENNPRLLPRYTWQSMDHAAVQATPLTFPLQFQETTLGQLSLTGIADRSRLPAATLEMALSLLGVALKVL